MKVVVVMMLGLSLAACGGSTKIIQTTPASAGSTGTTSGPSQANGPSVLDGMYVGLQDPSNNIGQAMVNYFQNYMQAHGYTVSVHGSCIANTSSGAYSDPYGLTSKLWNCGVWIENYSVPGAAPNTSLSYSVEIDKTGHIVSVFRNP